MGARTMSVKGSSEIETIVQNLRAVGLSLYEARLYLALLQHGAQNGNELSKSSGVPSSKVYSTAEKLIGLGIVHSIREGTTTKFVAIDPDELIGRLRSRYNEPIDFLTDALPSLAAAPPTDEAFLTGIHRQALPRIRRPCRRKRHQFRRKHLEARTVRIATVSEITSRASPHSCAASR